MKTDAMTRLFSVSYLRIADGAKYLNLNTEHIYKLEQLYRMALKYIFIH